MKDLLDRYLAAVERRLPKKGAKDIIAELREAISSKIEAKEAGLGRAAEADDIAAVLKEFGHPVVVASRYAGNDYLIGPPLYAWFWQAQKTAIGIAIAVMIAISAVGALDASKPVSAFIEALGDVWNVAIFTFGIVTVVFIVMERSKTPAKFGAGWDPKTLPQDQIRAPKSLFDTVFSLVFDVMFILWWVRWVNFPNQLPNTDGMSLHFSDAWTTVYTPILVLAVTTALVHLADLFHPAWSRLRSAVSILGHIGGLAVLGVLFQADRLVIVNGSSPDAARMDQIAWSVGGGLKFVLGFTALFWAIGLGVEIWRQIQATRPVSPPPIPAGA